MANEAEGKYPSESPESKLHPYTFPGERSYFLLKNMWKGDDARNTARPEGARGLYRVTCVLQKPMRSELPENTSQSADRQQGASFLRVTAQQPGGARDELAVRLSENVAPQATQFVGYLNDQGCLGRIVAHRVQADSFADAEESVRPAISRWLSAVSLALDVPCAIASVDVQELATGNHRIESVSGTVEERLMVLRRLYDEPDIGHFTSLYREALNSNSLIYSFLCLFKVIEGGQHRRNQINRTLREQGELPRSHADILPADFEAAAEWLNALFPYREWDRRSAERVIPADCLGKKLGQVVEKHLRPLRTAVAHAVLSGGELAFSPDDILGLRKVERLSPLTRCLARHVLRREFPAFFAVGANQPGEVSLVRAIDTLPNDGVFESPGVTAIQIKQQLTVRYPSRDRSDDTLK